MWPITSLTRQPSHRLGPSHSWSSRPCRYSLIDAISARRIASWSATGPPRSLDGPIRRVERGRITRALQGRDHLAERLEEAGAALAGLLVLLVGEVPAALAEDQLGAVALGGERVGDELERLADLALVGDGDHQPVGLVDLHEPAGPRDLAALVDHGPPPLASGAPV